MKLVMIKSIRVFVLRWVCQFNQMDAFVVMEISLYARYFGTL